ncbi:putative nuclease HARBI1 [Saccostrea echinata]|uniref:putative nuclease HARBI1 n=1 Tax=Saccostrea echinata TaxID=191078 RepID=UPI002A835CF1|nr:putative nuclease HARBI1 [Saccostrea echinata]
MAYRRRRRRKYRRFLLRRERPERRVVKDRLNPMEVYTDDELYERFRFRRPTIVYLMTLIEHKLINTTKNQALPPLLQLLVCLRFLATGAFHKLIEDSVNVSECTVSRCCRSVTQAINDIRQNFIMFPRDQTARQTKQEFLKIAGN